MPYSNEHKAKSRQVILNAATELFSRSGFDKVSISDIMNAARMTHGAFYAHFESKEALFRASFLETLKGSRAARLVKGPLTIKHLSALVNNYWNLRELEQKDRPGPEVVLFNEVSSENSNIKRLFEISYENLKKMIETRLTALSKLKRLPVEYNKEIIAEKSRSILASMVGAVVVAKGLNNEEERQRVLEASQNQILNMLGFAALQNTEENS